MPDRRVVRPLCRGHHGGKGAEAVPQDVYMHTEASTGAAVRLSQGTNTLVMLSHPARQRQTACRVWAPGPQRRCVGSLTLTTVPITEQCTWARAAPLLDGFNASRRRMCSSVPQGTRLVIVHVIVVTTSTPPLCACACVHLPPGSETLGVRFRSDRVRWHASHYVFRQGNMSSREQYSRSPCGGTCGRVSTNPSLRPKECGGGIMSGRPHGADIRSGGCGDQGPEGRLGSGYRDMQCIIVGPHPSIYASHQDMAPYRARDAYRTGNTTCRQLQARVTTDDTQSNRAHLGLVGGEGTTHEKEVPWSTDRIVRELRGRDASRVR